MKLVSLYSTKRILSFSNFLGLSLVFQFEGNGVSDENIEGLAGQPACAHVLMQRAAH